MSIEEIKSQLQAELPTLLQQDMGFRLWLEDLIRRTAVSSERFDDRFDRVLRELAADREAQKRKWDEQNRKWDEQNRKWDEQNRKWDEQNRKWDEQNRHLAEQNRKWDEQNRINHQLLDEIRQARTRHEQSIGALGARWGLASEASFRSALKGILEKSFGVEVINVNEFDDEGTVFGVPDQVEIDIIVRNGHLILCELKSSMSKSDIYTFERKVQYYQRRHGREVSRKLVISPMVRPEARPVAERLGIEVFGYAEDVENL
ncbi:MAG: DUF3782 domain-containing protein [Lamprobacter sp.]|uniref:PD-(D/E)XK nuclease family protein n=1 Tax=Lamprobacter sp. TaxID=3100796 RepID=UPI002B25977B|nr:DUF3782 domain-containing protein [Lamprobacter sp.]MEA3640673.1 DUF3782 domain-containing protein [Lamprobacter sp.]